MQSGSSDRAARHRKVRALFDAAQQQSPENRIVFVKHNSAGDPEVEREVLRLLAASDGARGGGFLDRAARERPTADSLPAESELLPGTAIGPYRIVRKLGAGGMGAVYLVERADQVFERKFALKAIRPDCATEDFLQRFHQERRILGRLDHPNIARIVDGGTTSGGLPFFVMEYVEGEVIDTFCRKRRLGLTQRLRLIQQVCSAIQYMHDNRIIHRDIKPGNLLVTARGEVKLLDFGIAKAQGESLKGRTTTGAGMMTPAFASPEQLAGKKATPASDVYSIGVLAYHLLVGEGPFAEATRKGLSYLAIAMSTEEPPPPSQRAGTVPEHVTPESAPDLRRALSGDLDRIILMSLRKDPPARYDSPAALSEDIERYLQRRPVRASSGGPLYHLVRFVDGNRMAAGAIALIVLLATWAIYLTLEKSSS